MFIEVKVKTSTGKSELLKLSDGIYRANLRSVPEKGKANGELARLVARKFGTSISSVRIKSGQSASKKLLEIKV